MAEESKYVQDCRRIRDDLIQENGNIVSLLQNDRVSARNFNNTYVPSNFRLVSFCFREYGEGVNEQVGPLGFFGVAERWNNNLIKYVIGKQNDLSLDVSKDDICQGLIRLFHKSRMNRNTGSTHITACAPEKEDLEFKAVFNGELKHTPTRYSAMNFAGKNFLTGDEMSHDDFIMLKSPYVFHNKMVDRRYNETEMRIIPETWME